MAGSLLALVALSVYLAIARVYQVDEAQNAYVTMILARGKVGAFATSDSLFLLPFSAVLPGAASSARAFDTLRIGFLLLFWCNWLLLLRAARAAISPARDATAPSTDAGPRSASSLGLMGMGGLLLLLPLAPMWTYGLEVRHENVLLFGILCIWDLGRPVEKPNRSRLAASRVLPGFLAPAGGLGARTVRANPFAYGLMGLLTVWTQLSAFKAVAFWLPLTVGFLLWPHPHHGSRRGRLLGQWLLGALVGFALARLALGLAGTWPEYVKELTALGGATASVARVAPWQTLGKAFAQTPLVIAAVLLHLATIVATIRTKGRAALSWNDGLPELLLAGVGLGTLLVNPTPFPYNLVMVVALSVPAAARAARFAWERWGVKRGGRLALVAVFALFQVTPFLTRMIELVPQRNDRQRELMRWAEAMTDVHDPVYDSTGLVPSRDSIGYLWLTNLLNAEMFHGGPYSVRQMLEANPAPVILPTYRIGYLAADDLAFMREHYVALADDYWVLGSRAPSGRNTWRCLRSGRYVVLDLGKPAPVAFDGKAMSAGPNELAAGLHTLEVAGGSSVLVAWLGPRLDRLPRTETPVLRGIFPIPMQF